MADIIDESLPLDSDVAGLGASNIRATRAALNDLNKIVEDHVAIDTKPFTSLKTANYAITDIDLIKRVEVSTSATDVTITLPLKANNLSRRIEIALIAASGTAKVIVVPHASDVSAAHTISGDSLENIWLNKVGDYIVLQESANSGRWEIIDECLTCQLRLNTNAGVGSVRTCIPRFTNLTEFIGNLIEHNHTTGYSGNAYGLEVEILKSGKYAISLSHYCAQASNSGITVNNTAYTTQLAGLSVATVLAVGFSSPTTTSVVVRLNKGDIIQPHTDFCTPNSAICHFTMTYLGK